MSRPSNKAIILEKGLEAVHRHGFNGSSVRDIVQAAGVPQGSFTNHFASKEVFGLEILDLYFAQRRALLGDTLLNDGLSPLRRLKAFLDASIRIDPAAIANGCLFGNMAAEICDHSEPMRQKLAESFNEVHRAIALCLKNAIKAQELSAPLNCNEVATFIISSLQGAVLLAKVQRSAAPLKSMKKLLFSTVLR